MQKGGYSGLVLPQLMKAMDSKGSVIKNTTKKKDAERALFLGGKEYVKEKKMQIKNNGIKKIM